MIGKLAGAEIARLYVFDKDASVPRPEKELKGFISKVFLQPGESKTIILTLTERDFACWSILGKQWLGMEALRFISGAPAKTGAGANANGG